MYKLYPQTCSSIWTEKDFNYFTVYSTKVIKKIQENQGARNLNYVHAQKHACIQGRSVAQVVTIN